MVVTAITPLAALEPYSAEAAAPFTTSIDSTSSALISARLPVIIVPSTMINGPDPTLLRLLSALSCISNAWPGSPPKLEVLTPATFPVKAEAKEVGGTALILSALILVTETVIFSREVAPATPVTITSPSVRTVLLVTIVTAFPEPTIVSVEAIPAPEIINTSPDFAWMLKRPLLSAATPVLVPLTLTEAPGTASPFSSVTVPVIVRF